MSGEQPRTQVSRGDVSLDTSHPSLVIPHGQTQAVAQNVKKPKLSEYACTVYEVECYVLDCVRDVIPKAFWGSEANRKVVEKSELLSSLFLWTCNVPWHVRWLIRITADVSQLLRYRRYESVSLHALLQGFSVLDCQWLSIKNRSSKAGPVQQQRGTAADMDKRLELLSEFMYWFFDSFIIDLVRVRS